MTVKRNEDEIRRDLKPEDMLLKLDSMLWEDKKEYSPARNAFVKAVTIVGYEDVLDSEDCIKEELGQTHHAE